MAENQQNQSSDQSTGTADRPATTQSGRRGSTPAVFGDGSTREQQQELMKNAEQANRETKEYADADRKARSDS